MEIRLEARRVVCLRLHHLADNHSLISLKFLKFLNFFSKFLNNLSKTFVCTNVCWNYGEKNKGTIKGSSRKKLSWKIVYNLPIKISTLCIMQQDVMPGWELLHLERSALSNKIDNILLISTLFQQDVFFNDSYFN